MPLDTSIPLQVKQFQAINPQEILSLQHLAQTMQMQDEQLKEFRRKRESENSLRTLFSEPDAIDPTTKQPTLATLQKTMAIDPAVGVKMRGDMITAQEKLAQTDKAVAQTRAALANVDEKDRKIMSQIQIGAHDLYEQKLKETKDPVMATQAAQGYFSSRVDEEDKLGVLNKKYIESAKANPFDPQRSAIIVQALRPLGQERGTPPTDLKRLMDERDALPADSPRRKEYDDKIKKLNAPTQTQINLNAPKTDTSVLDFTKKGDDFIKQLPQLDQNTVKGLLNYDIDPKTIPGGMVMVDGQKRSRREYMIALARQADPEYSETAYREKQIALAEFQRTKGNATRFLNVSIDHIDTASEYAKALKNGDIQRVNQLKNWWAQETGQAAPNTFNGIKDIVASEVIKGAIGGPGGVEERKANAEKVKAANSPEQLDELFKGWKKLMAGQMKGLEKAYESGTRLKNFREKYMLPRARKALEEVSGDEAPSRRSTDQISAEDQALIDKYKGK